MLSSAPADSRGGKLAHFMPLLMVFPGSSCRAKTSVHCFLMHLRIVFKFPLGSEQISDKF